MRVADQIKKALVSEAHFLFISGPQGITITSGLGALSRKWTIAGASASAGKSLALLFLLHAGQLHLPFLLKMLLG